MNRIVERALGYALLPFALPFVFAAAHQEANRYLSPLRDRTRFSAWWGGTWP